MKNIFLGGKHGSVIGNYALVDDADFDWLNVFHWCAKKQGNTFYAETMIGGRSNRICLKMHRLILRLIDRKMEGDHKNGNGLDNRRSNLRTATHSQNVANKRCFKNRYLGVYVEKQKRGIKHTNII